MAEKTICTIPAPLPEELVVRQPDREFELAVVRVAEGPGFTVPVDADELTTAVKTALNEDGTGRIGFEAGSI